MEDGPSCGVCLQSFGKERVPLALPCQHSFCATCMAMLDLPKKCPFCRAPCATYKVNLGMHDALVQLDKANKMVTRQQEAVRIMTACAKLVKVFSADNKHHVKEVKDLTAVVRRRMWIFGSDQHFDRFDKLVDESKTPIDAFLAGSEFFVSLMSSSLVPLTLIACDIDETRTQMESILVRDVDKPKSKWTFKWPVL